ncbi:TPA: AfsA-related hotdog domain-containing protein [Providencia alcalifaciens]
MLANTKKPDKKLVHKSHDEDVIIYNTRNQLPSWLPINILTDKELLDNDLKIINETYKVCNNRLVLRTLPETLSLTDNIINNIPNITDYYKKTLGNQLELKEVFIPEYIESILSEELASSIFISNEKRNKIFTVVEKLSKAYNNEAMYFTLFNDTKNYFFYRKHHEHVPGLMLIEAARQAMYIQFYKFSGYKLGDVSISITSLDSKFPHYTESSYPVDILVYDNNNGIKNNIRKVDKIANFYQNNKLIASIQLQGEVIKLPVFKRIRNINIDDSHWFKPLKGISDEILIYSKIGNHFIGHLEYLSMTAFQVKVLDRNFLSEKNELIYIYIYVKNFGVIHFPIKSIENIKSCDDHILRVNLSELRSDSKFKLREIIKQFSYLSHYE